MIRWFSVRRICLPARPLTRRPRRFPGRTGFEDAGNYSVTIVVSDIREDALSDSETVTITVGNVNRPPGTESHRCKKYRSRCSKLAVIHRDGQRPGRRSADLFGARSALWINLSKSGISLAAVHPGYRDVYCAVPGERQPGSTVIGYRKCSNHGLPYAAEGGLYQPRKWRGSRKSQYFEHHGDILQRYEPGDDQPGFSC